MNLSFKINLSVYSILLIFFESEALQLPHSDEEEYILSSALKVSRRTAEISSQALLYVLGINSEFPMHTFIRRLHENMIETAFINSQSWFEDSTIGGLVKNIIVILNDLDEIPSLILGSASDSIVKKVSGLALRDTPKLKHYCIESPLFNADANKTCDYHLQITPSELKGEGLLTDPVCELTKGLYANSVWNANNYIVFILPITEGFKDSDKNAGDQLKFVLIFSWRFFRGLRTVVCLGRICHTYDPFTDTIIATNENYSFTNISLRGKIFEVGFIATRNALRGDMEKSSATTSVIYMVPSDIMTKFDCMIHFFSEMGNERSNPFEWAQRGNYDMLVFDGTFSPNDDFTLFDFSAAIYSFSYCFAIPRSNFVPQSLVPFKCFSLTTWAVILTAVLLLYTAFYVFHRSQWRLFDRIYSRHERHAFEHTSVLFYLYSYLVVGGPSTLLLGRIITGKILFLIVSLFVLIIVTVFQSQMTNLISKPVRYPEMDTLEELKNSDLLIQTPDLEISLELLRNHPFFETLRGKLIQSNYFVDEMQHWDSNTSEIARKKHDISTSWRSMIESDAFEIAVPNLRYKFEGTIQPTESELEGTRTEYHLVKECVLSYALTLPIQRNPFLSDLFIRQIEAYVEMGFIGKFLFDTGLQERDLSDSFFVNDVDKEDSFLPKAFTINDLQPAFVSLVVGWILSGIVFVLELVLGNSNEDRTTKFTRWFERVIIRPSSLGA
ncbi:unnamed protein product [Bemisia tabaci]|uniref:Ionotropic receptor n=1 Tax=Bemisia tabaci TaxID=7038 RepID=A0A9P0A3L4_BEMTA|nr:unnamed protein product [Bemisia tabaci]